MKTIKSILDDVFRKQNLESRIKGYHVFDVWEEVVGPRIARHTQPKRFRDHILWVVVDTTIWMQQLKFLEGKIKEKLNQAIGSPMIEKIRFQIGEIACPPKEETEAAVFPEWSQEAIGDNVKKKIEEELAPLHDEALKQRLRDLFQKNSQFLRYQEKE